MRTSFSIVGTKFSLGSTVDICSPRISKFVLLVADHVCIANALASFNKEKKALVEGKLKYMMNFVEEVHKKYKLSSDEAAKFITLAIQVEVEKVMAKEMTRINIDSMASELEKEFVRALLFLASGNIMILVVVTRYGDQPIGNGESIQFRMNRSHIGNLEFIDYHVPGGQILCYRMISRKTADSKIIVSSLDGRFL